jgi:hypothetical protein
MGFVLRGLTGSVWVGARKACDLGGWTCTSHPGDTSVIAATVRNVNRFWAKQPATQIRLTVGRGEWRWRVSAVAADAGTYRVSGPPEER